jgi:hypothetical protein
MFKKKEVESNNKTTMNNFSQYIEKKDHFLIVMLAKLADLGFRVISWEEYYNTAKEVGYLNADETQELINRRTPGFISTGNNNPQLEEKSVLLIILSKELIGSNGDRFSNGFRVSSEQIFNLIDFIELKQAKENSKEAKKQSTLAIIISVFALIASLIIGYIQIFDKIEIEESQLKYLHEQNNYYPVIDSLNFQLNKVNEKLDSLNNMAKQLPANPKK